ncbi:MAG: carboxy-terminal processing protease precursor [Bacteroidetes bacterium]|nr:carboxy-terminal processing protease precursor [Bacteroidota bacterium]
MKTKYFVLSFFVFCCGLSYGQNSTYQINYNKMSQLLRAINELYVDTVNFNAIVENATVEMLKELDPHTIYIPVKDVQQANEPLQGAFDGIGVTFQLIKDTINVMEVIVGGPSDKVGLMAGDKIIQVDTAVAYGKEINNQWVMTHLRGKKGTKVEIHVRRGNNSEPLIFTIVRDKIPMNSINVFFMVDQNTGYIRLERFAATSKTEFSEALHNLQNQGMKNLIFDLRGNGGGYLNTAFEIADEFIENERVIVYTDNFRKTGENLLATKIGDFEKGKLIILVDEGSASASEIVSGAVQDWDRGLIMGRRTFGKGLVQKPLNLADQSQVRLTISRYYTPTGRCIQKPYNDGLDSYLEDIQYRSQHGELYTADSIHFPDSLKYKTPNGKIVYGGGGIMPDIFIPLDTTKYSSLYGEMFRKGVFSGFTLDYMNSNRELLKAKYPTIQDFKKNFVVSDDLLKQVMDYAHKEGVEDSVPLYFSRRAEIFFNEKKELLDSLYKDPSSIQSMEQFNKMFADYMNQSYSESMQLRNLAKINEFIKEAIMFEFARNLFSYGEAYQIFLLSDETFLKAVQVINDDKVFKKFKVSR